MRDYILERAKEPSTWRGVVMLLTAIGVPIAPGAVEYVVAIGMGVAGLLGILTADK